MLGDDLPARIAGAPSMQRAFDLLLAYPSIGDFLAYQYLIALNYAGITTFSEMDFVVAGPGAVNGIRKCFSDTAGLNEEVFDALVLLAAGSLEPAALRRGHQAVLELQREMDAGRRARLQHLGYGPEEAAALSGLHTRNFM